MDSEQMEIYSQDMELDEAKGKPWLASLPVKDIIIKKNERGESSTNSYSLLLPSKDVENYKEHDKITKTAKKILGWINNPTWKKEFMEKKNPKKILEFIELYLYLKAYEKDTKWWGNALSGEPRVETYSFSRTREEYKQIYGNLKEIYATKVKEEYFVELCEAFFGIEGVSNGFTDDKTLHLKLLEKIHTLYHGKGVTTLENNPYLPSSENIHKIIEFVIIPNINFLFMGKYIHFEEIQNPKKKNGPFHKVATDISIHYKPLEYETIRPLEEKKTTRPLEEREDAPSSDIILDETDTGVLESKREERAQLEPAQLEPAPEIEEKRSTEKERSAEKEIPELSEYDKFVSKSQTKKIALLEEMMELVKKNINREQTSNTKKKKTTLTIRKFAIRLRDEVLVSLRKIIEKCNPESEDPWTLPLNNSQIRKFQINERHTLLYYLTSYVTYHGGIKKFLKNTAQCKKKERNYPHRLILSRP